MAVTEFNLLNPRLGVSSGGGTGPGVVILESLPMEPAGLGNFATHPKYVGGFTPIELYDPGLPQPASLELEPQQFLQFFDLV